MKTIITSLIALAFMAFPALSAVTCVPIDAMAVAIKEKGFVVVWTCLGVQNEVYSIVLDPKSGKWAAVVVPADGSKACFVAEGTKQKLVGVGA